MIKLNQQIHPASRRSALWWISEPAKPLNDAYHGGSFCFILTSFVESIVIYWMM
nr:MAG TPA_asm: hypothetical protein [Caudoviricetes sp.]